MGDLLLTTPLIRAIRRRYPETDLTVATQSRYAPLFQCNPHITRVAAYDSREPLRAFARELRRLRLTHRLDLHRSLRSRLLRLQVGGRWTSYSKYRAARTILIQLKRNTYRDTRPVAERYFDAAKSLGVSPDGNPAEVFLPQDALDRMQVALAERGHHASRTLLAFAPGASHATKRWPISHWIELVRHVTEGVVDVVVLGGPRDRHLGAALASAAPDRAFDMTGACTLLESAALLKLSRTAVAGDTGLLHLATAVGTPIVGLYGPTVEAFGFFPYQARGTVLEQPLSCRPCSAFGGPKCPLGHHDCLASLAPVQVARAIGRLRA